MGSGTGDVRVAIVPSAGIEHNVISRAAVEGTSFAEGADVFRLSAFESAAEPTDWTAAGLSLIHISEPTRLRRISYAVFCLKKKNTNTQEPRQETGSGLYQHH